MHRLQELVRLHRMGTGAREVARLLRVSPNTERFWRTTLDAAGLLKGPADEVPAIEVLAGAAPERTPPQQVSSVADVEPRIKELLKKGAQPRAIYDRLRLDDGDFTGSYWAVKRLCARLAKEAPVSADDVAIPVETVAGQVAQVDFGYAGHFVDPTTGQQRRGWAFVMVLGHSRHLFSKIVFDQSAVTWQQLHVEAFAFFGGVPAIIVPDNLKAAVVRAAFGVGDDPSLNRSYCELALHYGFKIDPTPPRDPEKKGKVERSVQYVRRNALKTMAEALVVTEANHDLQRWVLEIAGTRIHGRTRRRPLEVFEAEEKSALLALPARPFVPVVWKKAKVHRDSHVVLDYHLYSVPWKHIGAEAWVRATPTTVVIYVDDHRVCDHGRGGPGGRTTVEAHLPEHRRDLRHRGQDWWRGRAMAIGPETAALVEEIFSGSEVLNPIRKVQAIVTHLETFPRDRAEGAARRARHFAVHDYRGIRDILKRALDKEPLPLSLPFSPGAAPSYRFTRPVQEMLDRHTQETRHEHN